MTGRCKKQRKVMAGDCNADETTKIDNPNFDTEITEKPSGLTEITELPQVISGLDSYCQAYKSVAFCSPYDSEESPPPAVSVTDAKTLPNRVWHLLVKQSDGRKRKKWHSGTEKKSLSKVGKSIIWVETEEYFKELTVEDIERLERVSGDGICLRYNVLNRMSKHAYDKDNLSLGNGRQDEVKEEVVVKEENESTSMDACENDSLNLGNGGLDEVQEVTVKKETEPSSMDGDGDEKTLVEFEHKKESNGVKRENGEKDLNCFSGLEWLLASRNKVYLSSERPSKKRKLLGSDAGLEKLLVACPVEGLDSVCHYCSYGERGDLLNCLIKCASCGMMVHQRCYGVTEDVDGSWLCSWCKWKNSVSLSTERPCLLCPKSGGALKPIEKSTVTSEDGAKFAHLFCCQWMPEVYLENTRTMEPIMNINGLNDTKKKLICYLCKVKWGASVWCSNGACRTSFHPICAREAKHRMEIWGKLGCDEVELRAFCSKHSGIQYNRRNRKAETLVDDSVSHIHKEIVDTASESHKPEISQQNGDKSQISVDTADTDPSEAIDDSGGDLVDSRSSSESHSENGDVLQSVKFLPHQRKAEGEIRTVKDDKSCHSEDKVNNVVADDVLCPVDADSNGTCTESTSDVTDKMLIDPSEQHNDSSINGSLRIEDEIEGELIYYQQRILYNALQRKQLTDDLISKVARTLPLEIDAAERKKWDAVLVSQYNHELRESKKKGRKERQNKEAQAVLAAATAAASTSSRLSTRKDAQEDSATHEDLLKSNPRVTNTVCRSNFSKDGLRICEICTRSQTILNPVLVCSSCKVAVHLDCYRSVKSTTGPWQCELCEDLFSSLSTNSLERKPYFVAECGLCGGTASAFRKSVNGQWIHALCAEWVLESKYRRGQVKPIEGMETVSKGNNTCTVCHRKQGACLKCSYGHCHSMFHPTCARSAGFYMTVRTSGGKLQQKAYCARHSSEQRAKADTQKHGVEEFKSLKQVRVELERLRLLCERIIKREKLKRELVLCSHDILSSNRDSVLCTLARHPFYQPEVSSESATTSIRGYSHQSGSDTIQRSDDITIDSTFAGKRHVKIPVSMDNDQRTVDSSTSHSLYTLKPTERVAFSGKQIQRLPIASLDISEDAEARSNHKKHAETFGKELIMTSDQASIRNQRLPKGFVYVPIRSISKDKKNDSYVPDVSGT